MTVFHACTGRGPTCTCTDRTEVCQKSEFNLEVFTIAGRIAAALFHIWPSQIETLQVIFTTLLSAIQSNNQVASSAPNQVDDTTYAAGIQNRQSLLNQMIGNDQYIFFAQAEKWKI